MTIKTAHQTIAVLFEQNQTFEVPKYQREYAWDSDAIDDFIEDIRKCLEMRLGGRQRNHFFGGIVCARLSVEGSSRANYQIIDGQQRISSFVMLASSIVLWMNNISKSSKLDSKRKGGRKALEYIDATVAKIKTLYLTHQYAKDLEYKVVPKLTLSKADNKFFQSLLDGAKPNALRPSHRRIEFAWKRICDFIGAELDKEESTSGKATRLQHLIDCVLAEDCTVIFMWSDSRSEAYRIFQVLNDRGVNLTNGDLLRARTLELLDDEQLRKIQEQVADRWDSALAYTPGSIDDYLMWYFASYQGFRPKQSDVTDKFMEFRFGESSLNSPITCGQAKGILDEVGQLDVDFALLEQLVNGEWPFDDVSTVTQWDKMRLGLLVGHLKHTNAMPLIMACKLLGPKRFAECIASLERFVFRYKTIGNAHIGPATKLYQKHATLIRSNSGAYKVSILRKELGKLVDRYASGKGFATAISELTYSPRGGNGHIRYVLLGIEDYYRWYDSGANGTPVCKEKTRVMDMANTTLEHVYSQNLENKDRNENLESVKHSLGNLTILGPGENVEIGNCVFSDKVEVFRKSSLRLNREIAKRRRWSKNSVVRRTKLLAEMADRIFVP